MGRAGTVEDLSARGRRFGLVASRFNAEVCTRLVASAQTCLVEHGAAESDLTTVWVPGAVEIPLVAQRLITRRDARAALDAVLALGAVIRGETPHFDYVARIVADGVLRVSLATGVPVVFGVLTTDTMEQAMARVGGPAGDKGREAALTAIEMAQLMEALGR
jgi:6,7-dimethyl-8-ribityllumazine synthase